MTTHIRTDQMTDLERVEWMLERCEEIASHDEKLSRPARGYAISEIDWIRSNVELFRCDGKMYYYWAVASTHEEITGTQLPEERIIVQEGSDHLQDSLASPEIDEQRESHEMFDNMLDEIVFSLFEMEFDLDEKFSVADTELIRAILGVPGVRIQIAKQVIDQINEVVHNKGPEMLSEFANLTEDQQTALTKIYEDRFVQEG